MEYKMIVSDMDGTLLQDHTTLSQENKETIIKAMEAGVEFVIATGRSVLGVVPYLKQLGVYGNEGFVICQNGGAVYSLKDVSLHKKYNFTTDEFEAVYKYASDVDGTEFFFYDDIDLIVEENTQEVKDYCAVMGIEPIVTDKPMEYESGFTKVVIHGTHEELLKVQANARAIEGSTLECFFSNDRYLEFVKKGVNKGTALEFIANELGIDIKQVIAIGDSENDISMIAKAGLGVAMGNSMGIVKDAADVVLDKSNKDHGVADMINKFIFKVQ